MLEQATKRACGHFVCIAQSLHRALSFEIYSCHAPRYCHVDRRSSLSLPILFSPMCGVVYRQINSRRNARIYILIVLQVLLETPRNLIKIPFFNLNKSFIKLYYFWAQYPLERASHSEIENVNRGESAGKSRRRHRGKRYYINALCAALLRTVTAHICSLLCSVCRNIIFRVPRV